MKQGTLVTDLDPGSKWYLIVPRVGSFWVWEPELAHARQIVKVTKALYNGEEWVVWCVQVDKNGEVVPGSPEVYNELYRWIEACVLVDPGHDQEPHPDRTWISDLNQARLTQLRTAEHNAALHALGKSAAALKDSITFKMTTFAAEVNAIQGNSGLPVHRADGTLLGPGFVRPADGHIQLVSGYELPDEEKPWKAKAEQMSALAEERRVRLHDANNRLAATQREYNTLRNDASVAQQHAREEAAKRRTLERELAEAHVAASEAQQGMAALQAQLDSALGHIAFARQMGYELINKTGGPDEHPQPAAD
jgi:hypothetical protein